MNDVFDDELIKELGLDPEDLGKSKTDLKKKPISKKTAPEKAAKPPVPKSKPKAEESSISEPTKSQAPEPPQTVEPESLEEQAIRVSQDIPVHLAAVIAKKSVKLKDILELKTGEVLNFKKLPQEPLDLVANGKLIAKAELVLIDGKLGARIVKLIK